MTPSLRRICMEEILIYVPFKSRNDWITVRGNIITEKCPSAHPKSNPERLVMAHHWPAPSDHRTTYCLETLCTWQGSSFRDLRILKGIEISLHNAALQCMKGEVVQIYLAYYPEWRALKNVRRTYLHSKGNKDVERQTWKEWQNRWLYIWCIARRFYTDMRLLTACNVEFERES